MNPASLFTAAASSLVWSRSRAGWALLPAFVPLALIPALGTHNRRHMVVALSAATFFVAGLVRAWR